MTHSYRRLLSPIIAAALLLGSGFVCGTWTHRWQTPARPNGSELLLHRVPLSLDDWDGKDSEISDAEQKLAGMTNYLQRTYTSRQTGESVMITLMCGPTGPIAVHPPTACYQGAGYQQSGATRLAFVNIPAAEVFAVADFFQPGHPEASQPRIYWAWSADGMWKVPDSPRLEFAGQPILFKLFVTFERPFDTVRSAASPAETLLKLLLPAIRREVFGRES